MANILTGIRIICGLMLLFFPAYSGGFTILYLLGGFTDAIDGTVARKLGKESRFGAKLDTAADFVFLLAVFIKTADTVFFALWVMIWVGILFILKVVSIIIGVIRSRPYIPDHSILNKCCGVILFFVLLFIGRMHSIQGKTMLIASVCLLATAASVQELLKAAVQFEKNDHSFRKTDKQADRETADQQNKTQQTG